MRLSAVTVKGLRCLADVGPIPIGNPAILTGPNDAGKSTLLLAIEFLFDNNRLLGRDDLSRLGVEGDERAAEIVVEGTFDQDAAAAGVLDVASPVTLRRVYRDGQTSLEVHANVPVDVDLRDLGNHLALAELQERAERLGVESDGPRTAKASYLGPLERAAAAAPKEEAWVRATQELAAALPRIIKFASTHAPDPEQEIASSLREVYSQLLEDEDIKGPIAEVEATVQERLNTHAQALCGHIRERCQELQDVDVLPAVSFKGGFQGVQLRAGRGGDASEGLREAGAGRKRRITLAIWEWVAGLLETADRDGSVLIAYDEPDTHLDYLRQRQLMDLIGRQAGLDNAQVVVATHSLNLIDRVEISDVIALELAENGHSVVRTLDDGGHRAIDEHLQRVAISMGLRNSVLLHERCFVIVEGDTEMGAFPLLFRTVTGHSLQAAGIALLNGGSNDGALRVARFLNDNGRQARFVLDEDSRTNPASRKIFKPERLRRFGIGEELVFYIGDPDHIEDLFPDAQWAAIANERWPRVDGKPWQTGDFAALREGNFGSALEALVRPASEAAPLSKAGYVGALAEAINDADELPTQLVECFRRLFDIANDA